MRIFVYSLAAILVVAARGEPQQADSHPTVDKLLLTLKTGRDGAKRNAIEELGNLGAGARGAVPALTKIVTDHRNSLIAEQAIIALGTIGPAAESSLPALHARAGTMAHGERELAENASIAIGRIGQWSPGTTRSILPLTLGNAAYSSANPDVTLPQLFELLSDKDQETRARAIFVWRRLAVERNEEVLMKHPDLRAKVLQAGGGVYD
jgi:HEAT repeat protein